MLAMMRKRLAEDVERLVREHISRGLKAVLDQYDKHQSDPTIEVLADDGKRIADRKRTIRILIAKPGLDGHDRGAKIISLALRDAGMEVLYSGLHKSIDHIVATAIQESVDVIGLSIMTGAHMPICKRLIKRLQEEKASDIHVVVGGVIPKHDIPKLEDLGAKCVFPSGTRLDRIISAIRALF